MIERRIVLDCPYTNGVVIYMPFEPKTKKVLTRPTFKTVVDVPLYVKIQDKMFIGKERVGRDGKKSDKAPPTVINVMNLETGELGQVLANTILKQTLEEEYPNDGYVNLCFAITKQKRKEGKQYDPFNILEIEDPTETKTETPKVVNATPHRRA